MNMQSQEEATNIRLEKTA